MTFSRLHLQAKLIFSKKEDKKVKTEHVNKIVKSTLNLLLSFILIYIPFCFILWVSESTRLQNTMPYSNITPFTPRYISNKVHDLTKEYIMKTFS